MPTWRHQGFHAGTGTGMLWTSPAWLWISCPSWAASSYATYPACLYGCASGSTQVQDTRPHPLQGQLEYTKPHPLQGPLRCDTRPHPLQGQLGCKTPGHIYFRVNSGVRYQATPISGPTKVQNTWPHPLQGSVRHNISGHAHIDIYSGITYQATVLGCDLLHHVTYPLQNSLKSLANF